MTKGKARPGSAAKGDVSWIKPLGLVMGDRAILQTHARMLNTTHMEAVSAIIGMNKPEIAGLRPPLEFRADGFDYVATEAIQLHHTGSQHFVASTSIGGSPSVFDSLFRSPNPKLAKQLHQLYARPDQHYVVVKWMPMQQQEGGLDCGLFAAAVAVELAVGTSPDNVANIHFNQHTMRKHMFDWFERELKRDAGTRQIEPFPKSPRALETSKRVQPGPTYFAIAIDGLLTKEPCASAEAAREQADAAIIARAVAANSVSERSQRSGRVRKASAKKADMAATEAMAAVIDTRP